MDYCRYCGQLTPNEELECDACIALGPPCLGDLALRMDAWNRHMDLWGNGRRGHRRAVTIRVNDLL